MKLYQLRFKETYSLVNDSVIIIKEKTVKIMRSNFYKHL